MQRLRDDRRNGSENNWSIVAANNKDEILKYWLFRNKSYLYPRKLNKLLHQTLKLLSKNPQLGRRTNVEGIRSKLIRDYFLLYQFTDKTLEVLMIGDSKRDPKDVPFKT